MDTTFLFDQYSKRGIGRYGKEILKRLVKEVFETKGWELQLIGFYDLEQNLIEAGLSRFAIEEFTHPIGFHSLGKPVDSGFKNLTFWGSKMRPIIMDVNPDVYFGVHFERGLPTTKILGNGMDIKTVVTAHDTIPFINNSFSSKGYLQNLIKKSFFQFMWSGVQNADAVIAPSENTKKDLVTYGEIRNDRIKRIYHGISEDFYKKNNTLTQETQDEILETYGLLSKSYLFYDSGLEANKGVHEMLESFASISKEEDMPSVLVVTGGSLKKGIGEHITARNVEGAEFLKKARKLEIMHKIVATDKIPDEDLIVLLQKADAYMYFSQYEGFGFGPVQAMAAEVPSIVANTSCLPEITAGASLLVDTADTEAVAKEVVEFLRDTKEVERLVKKGTKIVENYKWSISVEELWDLIQKISPVKEE